MRLSPQLPAALLALALAACSGSDPRERNDAGRAALGRGDARSALTEFEAVLGAVDAQHPEHFRAALSRCEALARLDGAAARQSFLELARVESDQVREDDYSLICSALLAGNATMDAIDVMHAGHERFADSPKMKAMVAAVVAAAEREETPDAVRRLEDMGYIGRAN